MGPSNLVRVTALVAFTFALVAACGSGESSEFGGGNGNADGGGDGGGGINNSGFGGDGGSGQCKPRTCQEQGVECGPAGDGCSGFIPNCGTCKAGFRCG